MANVRDVISFEVLRNLRKKTFWYASLAPPFLILAIIGISHASSQSSSNASQQQAANIAKSSKIAVLDETGIINKQALAQSHIATEPSKQAGISAIKRGTLGAFIYYPKDVSSAGIQVYAQDKGISNPTPYNGVATGLLVGSAKVAAATAVHDSQIVQILENSPGVTATTYKHGKRTNDAAAIIVPGIFMVAFLALIVLQTYLMITSTTEEKENRTAEMLLTSIRSRSLIAGKILSLFVLGLVQLLVIAAAFVVAYVLFRHHITLPEGVSLGHIPFDPKAATFGAMFFVGGIVLFTGFLVGFGSLFPSAQEAGRYVGLAMISALLPIYAIGYIINSSHSLIVNVFTYFPLTAPTTLLIRNAIGTVSVGQALTAFAVVGLSAVLAIAFAMKAFRYGAMEYGRRIGIKELLR